MVLVVLVGRWRRKRGWWWREWRVEEPPTGILEQVSILYHHFPFFIVLYERNHQ